MNQRRGKTHRAAMSDNDPMGMTVVTFFKEAALLLKEEGKDDASFYFEMVEEHLRSGGRLPSGNRDLAKVLGL